ncbi:PRG4 protein, partial [Polypterus senegalus]|nr:PRG4 protein [Polypterus senegalus]
MKSVHQLKQLKLSIIDSCHERCGEVYYRGHKCHCDYSCLIHKECCLDYEMTCTTGNSCKGRCGEDFQRGKQCDCDNECSQFGKCCPDYTMHCMNEKPDASTFSSPITTTINNNLIGNSQTTNNVSDLPVPDHDDSNLCIGRPANGMTTLRNGTTFVFRGHFFWMLNARGIEVGYPRKITEVWGIPSPIDTVFTRCNCQGKTFFFKGKNYWRFENGSLDPGYPKLISKGFNGLSGKITAALSVSAHQRKMESVYFFKQGGVFQKYTFEQQPSNKCAKPSTSLSIKVIRKRTAREAGGNLKIKAYLTKEIAISSLSGIQTSITSAISVPNPKSLDGYNYFLFSKNKYYNIKFINSTMPSLSSVHSNAHKDWYKCL